MLIRVWVFSPWPMEKLSVVRRAPVARPVELVEVRGGGRENRLELVLQIDAAPIAEAHQHAVLEDGVAARA